MPVRLTPATTGWPPVVVGQTEPTPAGAATDVVTAGLEPEAPLLLEPEPPVEPEPPLPPPGVLVATGAAELGGDGHNTGGAGGAGGEADLGHGRAGADGGGGARAGDEFAVPLVKGSTVLKSTTTVVQPGQWWEQR